MVYNVSCVEVMGPGSEICVHCFIISVGSSSLFSLFVSMYIVFVFLKDLSSFLYLMRL